MIDKELLDKTNNVWQKLTDFANSPKGCQFGSTCSCELHGRLQLFSNAVEASETLPRRRDRLEQDAIDGMKAALNSGWEKVLEG